MELRGKTILITGGASGIGLEAAKQFLAMGSKVIITGRNQAKLTAAKEMYPAITAIQSDIANAADAQLLYNQVKDLGGIDILYNNAGIMGDAKNLGVANEKHFEVAKNEIDINYLGVIRINNLFMDMLNSREGSAIINTTSVLSYLPLDLSPTYSATKAAMRFYTVSLRNHLAILKSKIKVFELSPPLVKTDMTTDLEADGISPEKLVNGLIKGLRNNTYTIRVGDTKIIYILHRFFPKLALPL